MQQPPEAASESLFVSAVIAEPATEAPKAAKQAQDGVNLDRSMLVDWVGKAAFLLRPVHERTFGRLKASDKLFADETTAPVLDPGRGRAKTGQLFVYASDDRPWGEIDPPGVAYLYAPDRKAEQPIPPPIARRRSLASLNSTASRARSAVAPPMNAASSGRRQVVPSSTPSSHGFESNALSSARRPS